MDRHARAVALKRNEDTRDWTERDVDRNDKADTHTVSRARPRKFDHA